MTRPGCPGTGISLVGGREPADRRDFEVFAGVSAHCLAAAQRRLDWLRRFWAADRAAGYQRRWAVAKGVIDEIKREDPRAAVSVKSLQRWEMWWRAEGLAGLVRDRVGRPAGTTGRTTRREVLP